MSELTFRVIPAAEFTPGEYEITRKLCEVAYEESFPDFLESLPDSVHVLGYVGDVAVSHACWVTRWLQPGDYAPLRTAYVELVATLPEHQGRGYATAVMRRLVSEVEMAGFELGGLSPSDPAFYARFGWESWRGPTLILSDDGIVPVPGNVMIYRLSRTPALDLDAPLSAEWRPGELW